MTIDRACQILDPEHREYYESIEPVNEACRMGVAALRARQGYDPADQPPPDRFLALTRFNDTVMLVQRRDWGDRDWLVGGMYIPKDIKRWWPLPVLPKGE